MAWVTPTLRQLRELSRDFITARLQSGSLIPNSVTRIISDANAGLAHAVFKYGDWLAKQMLPDTAEAEWLRNRHATIWLGGWKQATFSEGTVKFTGVEGTVIPEATELTVSTPSGVITFETTAQGTIGPTNSTTIAVRCNTAGTVGNLEDGTIVALSIAQTGVDGQATVVELSGGTDEETDDQLRSRVLDRIRNPPMGGDANDYVAWTLEVPGVTRAWASPLEMGVGTVTVRFMMDSLRSANDGFPLAEDIATVQAYLDTKRPVAVKDFYVVAPIPEPVNFTVQNLIKDDETVKANIEATVLEMLSDKAAPAYSVNGVSQGAQTIYAAWVSEAISSATGVESFTLVMDDHEMPSAGHMAVLGSIVYE